jgi:hypothetical protein
MATPHLRRHVSDWLPWRPIRAEREVVVCRGNTAWLAIRLLLICVVNFFSSRVGRPWALTYLSGGAPRQAHQGLLKKT